MKQTAKIKHDTYISKSKYNFEQYTDMWNQLASINFTFTILLII
jgi:hypothetical protein